MSFSVVLDTSQKEVVLQLVRNQYAHIDENLLQSKASKTLFDSFANLNSIDQKWAEIDNYMTGTKNAKRDLFRIITQAVIEALAPEKIEMVALDRLDEILHINDIKRKDLIEELVKREFEYTDYISLKLVRSLRENLEEIKRDDQIPLLNEKWQDLIDYCSNKHNHGKPLYNHFMDAVNAHRIDEDHFVHANVHFDKENPGLALKHLKAIQIHSPESFARMGDCYYAVSPDARRTHPEYKAEFMHSIYEARPPMVGVSPMLTSKSMRYIPKQKRPIYRQKISMAIDGMLRDGSYLAHFATKPFASCQRYKFKAFKASVAVSASYAAFPGMIVATLGKLLIEAFFVGLVVAPLGFAVALVGGTLGGIGGSVHGFFRARSIHPLNADEQKTLIINLQYMIRQPESDKLALITAIKAEYKKTKSRAASEKSLELLAVLESETLSPEVRWQAVQFYMLYKKNNFLVNNGKKLFCNIDRHIREHVAAKLSPQLSRTLQGARW